MRAKMAPGDVLYTESGRMATPNRKKTWAFIGGGDGVDILLTDVLYKRLGKTGSKDMRGKKNTHPSRRRRAYENREKEKLYLQKIALTRIRTEALRV